MELWCSKWTADSDRILQNINMHCPGIEPGSQEWESCMIPLHQQCLTMLQSVTLAHKLPRYKTVSDLMTG